jgi:hypothetical protein
MSSTITAKQQHNQRVALDKLYAIDSIVSVMFGVATLVAPHVFLAAITTGGEYNHSVHETLRYVVTQV